VSVKAEWAEFGWTIVVRDTAGHITHIMNPHDFPVIAEELGWPREKIDAVLAPMADQPDSPDLQSEPKGSE
jgi:hypothetical protein